MRFRTGSKRRMPASGSRKLSIRPVEFRMSANNTVRRLYSPPLMLRSRNSWFEFSEAEAACSNGPPQWPQKRLFGRHIEPQELHVRWSNNPHASQNAFVMSFSALQLRHCIVHTHGRTKLTASDPIVSASSLATCDLPPERQFD